MASFAELRLGFNCQYIAHCVGRDEAWHVWVSYLNGGATFGYFINLSA